MIWKVYRGLFFVLLIALIFSTNANAGSITITVSPVSSVPNSTDDEYKFKLEPSGTGDLDVLNITIPARYEIVFPQQSGKKIGEYRMFNKTSDKDKTIIIITANNTIAETVDVNYSTNSGTTFTIERNQSISNMTIGASNLRITKPSPSQNGFLNLSLGGTAGPIDDVRNNVTLRLESGFLRNPDPGSTTAYTWTAKAGTTAIPGQFTNTSDVKIAVGTVTNRTNVTLIPDTPVQVNFSNATLGVNITLNITSNVSGIANVTFRVLGSNINNVTTITSGVGERTTGISFIGIDSNDLIGKLAAPVTIRVSYDDTNLPVPEDTLRLFRLNEESHAWELTADSDVDTVNNIVFGNVTGFSTFGLFGGRAAAPPSGGPSGGGGTGGGGVTTSEPFDNIAKAERYDKNLIANTPVTYAFTAPEHGITEIVITGKENENAITLRVEVLKGTSKLVTVSPPGTVYKNVNAWLGTKRIKEALIRFKVESSWISSNNFATGDVKLLKWDGSKWVQLETTEKNKDAAFTYYEAKTDALSVFAITGLKGVVGVPTPTPSEITPTKTAVPEVTGKPTPGFEAILAIFAIALSVASLIKGRKRR